MPEHNLKLFERSVIFLFMVFILLANMLMLLIAIHSLAPVGHLFVSELGVKYLLEILTTCPNVFVLMQVLELLHNLLLFGILFRLDLDVF